MIDKMISGLTEAGIYESIEGKDLFLSETAEFLSKLTKDENEQQETLTWCYQNKKLSIALNYTNELARKFLIEEKLDKVT